MPLPASGPISFDDLNDDLGNSIGTTLSIRTAAAAKGLTTPDSMDEFYSTLTIIPTVESVPSSTGFFNITVIGDSNWTVSTSVSWLVTSVNSGTGDATITVQYTDNPFNFPRSGFVIVAWGGQNRTCSVSQQSSF